MTADGIERDASNGEQDAHAERPTGEMHAPAPPARAAALPWLWTLATTGVVIGVDQLSKAAVRKSIVPGETRDVLPGLQLVNTRNRGVAFGFLPGKHVFVTLLVGLALLVLVVYFARNRDRPLIWLPTGMLLGGAFGNVLDRLSAGSVTDFVKLPLGWPPFNVADAAITLGVLALLIVVESPAREPEASGGSPGD